jgi:hypothetical protein
MVHPFAIQVMDVHPDSQLAGLDLFYHGAIAGEPASWHQLKVEFGISIGNPHSFMNTLC